MGIAERKPRREARTEKFPDDSRRGVEFLDGQERGQQAFERPVIGARIALREGGRFERGIHRGGVAFGECEFGAGECPGE